MVSSREVSRLIDTNLYYENYQGVGVVWFAGKLNPREILKKPISISPAEVPRELERMLARVKRSSYEGSRINAQALKVILSSRIIVQRSPAISFPLGKLIEKSPGIAIGTYVGMYAAGSSPMLMLVTVPGGILIVSSAIAIARAVETGLHKKVLSAFKSRERAKKRR
jgi:hypothetical protein